MTNQVVITTKYLGPTNYRGARIKATLREYSATASFDYETQTGCEGALAALRAKFDADNPYYRLGEPVESAFGPENARHWIAPLIDKEA